MRGMVERSLFSNAPPSYLQEITIRPNDFESIAKLKGTDLLFPLSEMAATPVTLQTLYNIGKDPTQEDLMAFAQFLRRELAIRMAQRAVELSRLPHGLSEKSTILEVCGWYAEATSKLVHSEIPNTPELENAFTKLLKSMLRDHTSVVRNLALGCMEVKREVGPDVWVRIHGDIDRVLKSFYTSRIGVRFLMEQHITARDRLPGFCGIIQQACKPDEVAHNAAADASNLCYKFTGAAPPIKILCKTKKELGATTVTYVSSHIHYMLTELLKNSMRAVVQHHYTPGASSKSLPPVTVVIVRGEEDVTIRVSDEGGGIPRSQLGNMFSFLHSTAPVLHSKQHGDSRDSTSQPGQMRATSDNTPVLAGWGVGLPLSRTYARYFGGDLDIKSMDGFGTDAYLHLNVLGEGCENLPSKVLNSPAMSDSKVKVQPPGAFDPLHSYDAFQTRDY